MKIFKKVIKYLVILGFSVCVALFSVWLYYGEGGGGVFGAFLRGFEDRTLNWRFRFRYSFETLFNKKPKPSILDRIVIVAIDDKAIAKFGGSFPFDRQVWANYLNHFARLPEEKQPHLIFFDIVFSDPSRKPQSDTNLFQAFRNYRKPLAIDFILELSQAAVNLRATDPYFHKLVQRDSLEYTYSSVQSLKRFEYPGEIPYEEVSHYTKQVLVLSPLMDEVEAAGAANFFSDESGIYRYFPGLVSVFYNYKGQDGVDDITNVYYPSIQIGILLELLNSDLSQVVWKREGLLITNAEYKGKREDFFVPHVPRTRGYVGINYLAPPGSGRVRVVSLADITRVELPEGAILLTGMYSRSGTHDIWRSPFGEMFGIEHIAYSLYTLYEKRFLKFPLPWVEIVYIVFVVMAVALLSARGGMVWFSLGGVVSFLPFVVGAVGFLKDWHIVTFVPFLDAILTLVFAQVYVLITESREKAFIRQTFSSYLNPRLVDLLIENPETLQLGGSEREITIFFSSIKNFHEVTEGFTARDIVNFLNRYFGFMGDMIIEANGTLDKYMGEMIMAFWGAPIEDPQHAYRACKTAIDMLHRVELFNEEQKRLGLKPVVVNIGLNTGRAVVGNVGSDKQKNYTAIGDSVNLASRIKGLNKFYHTQIVLSEFTYAQVKERVVVRELDLTRVKGKKEPVRVYELWDIK
ncbi:MAG: adenylate/guanylate cyclase domain-containing protein [Brevinematales bacterium]|nr:adenylate/guanylate cyclase domain-containing protein [Brevinematales bacterium]